MSGEVNSHYRTNDRVPIILEVNYRTEMHFLNAKTRNISIGGMFIPTLYPLPEGTEINLRFAIPEVAIEFSVDAQIVWSISYEECQNEFDSGMGIKLINLDKGKSRILEEYLQGKAKELS